jgi:hypothetical protein
MRLEHGGVPPHVFFISVHSARVEVLCFDTVLQVFILRELADSLSNELVTICDRLDWFRRRTKFSTGEMLPLLLLSCQVNSRRSWIMSGQAGAQSAPADAPTKAFARYWVFGSYLIFADIGAGAGAGTTAEAAGFVGGSIAFAASPATSRASRIDWLRVLRV